MNFLSSFSYDEKAATEKLLQKMALTNYQVDEIDS